MKIPSLVTFDGDVMRSYRTSKEFKYLAKGNVVIEDKDYDVNTFTSLAKNANSYFISYLKISIYRDSYIGKYLMHFIVPVIQ